MCVQQAEKAWRQSGMELLPPDLWWGTPVNEAEEMEKAACLFIHSACAVVRGENDRNCLTN